MIASADLHLIRNAQNTDIQQTGNRWCFTVSENGCLSADFLQINHDLMIDVILAGIGAKCEINCGYLLNDNNMLKLNIHVIHQSSDTASKQQIKGIATDNSSLSFDGIITIPYDCQKCDGSQNHQGLILSDKASVSATPQLEIWADDVKCSHGSAVGPLDAEQLFYLQTRGLNEKQAKKILLSSFFGGLMPPEFDTVIQEWMARHV